MITDAQARKIAADWHGGQGSALYALASTGAVRGDLVREINRDVCDPLFQSDADITDLQSLLTYARLNRGRGPVDGWSRLWPE